MPKPIKLTKRLIDEMCEEFRVEISKIKMFDGKVNYNKHLTYKNKDDKATVLFSPTAYAKMLHLIMEWESEIAWHGVGERMKDSTFLISDILVYPQTVSGATVEMDTDEYAKWIIENIEDERFNNIIMQGHSHVNMGTSASTVDITHQEEILEQLTSDMYYIFMIWNKKLEKNIKIFDLANNTLYENEDIICNIDAHEGDIDNFIKDAKAQVQKKSYNTSMQNGKNAGYYYYGDNKSSEPSGSKDTKKKEKVEVGSGWERRGLLLQDEAAYDFYRT